MSDYKLNGKTVDYYGPEMTTRREKFLKVINDLDLVLMNKITEVDPYVMENWLDKTPLGNDDCVMDYYITGGAWACETHGMDSDNEYECEGHEPDHEIYQWYATNQNDAEFLARHNQYVTYSDALDVYFLAITHFGTAWDYVDSMVNDILEDK